MFLVKGNHKNRLWEFCEGNGVMAKKMTHHEASLRLIYKTFNELKELQFFSQSVKLIAFYFQMTLYIYLNSVL